MAETTIAEQLERLSTAKTNLRQSIIAKQPNDVTFSAARLDEYPAEVDKIKSTSSLTGATIVADDILADKVAYGNNGVPITGTIETISVSPTEIKTKDTTISVGKGYNPEAKTIQISADEQAKIAADNIKVGVSILGEAGTFTAVDDDTIKIKPGYVFHGLVGFVNGEQVIGTMPEYKGEVGEPIYLTNNLIYDTLVFSTNSTLPAGNQSYLYTNNVKGSEPFELGSTETKITLPIHNYQYNYQVKSFLGNSLIAQTEVFELPKLYNVGLTFGEANSTSASWNPPFVQFIGKIIDYQYDEANHIYEISAFGDGLVADEIFNFYFNYNETESENTGSSYHYGEGGFRIFEREKTVSDVELYFTAKGHLSIFGVPFPFQKGKIKIDTTIGQVEFWYQVPCNIYYQTETSYELLEFGSYNTSILRTNLPAEIQNQAVTIAVEPKGLDYISTLGTYATTITKS